LTGRYAASLPNIASEFKVRVEAMSLDCRTALLCRDEAALAVESSLE